MGYFDGLQFPRMDFSYLSDIGKTIGNTIESRQFGSVFKDGFPMDANGAPDYGKAIDMLGRAGYTKEALSLAQATDGNYGLGEYGIGNPIITQDADGKYHAWAPGRGGIPKKLDFGGEDITLTPKVFQTEQGVYEMPGKRNYNQGGPLATPLHSWDEPEETRGIDPGGRTVVPQEEIDPPAEWEPYRMGSAGDFGTEAGPTQIVPKDPQGLQRKEELGTAQGKQEFNLPAFEDGVRKMLRDLGVIEKDPDLSSVLGMIQGRMPDAFKGQNQSRVQSYINRFTGKEFLIAYEALRGAGAITEKEGEKAQMSISRLKEQGMSPQDYKAALQEAKHDLWELLNVARQKADPNAPRYKNPYKTGAPKNKVIDVREWLGM